MEKIAQELEKFTSTISNFDTSRGYISMSHAGLEEAEIIKQIDNGFEDSLQIRLRCYKGYQMERDLLDRIKKLYTTRIETPVEISAYNGIVQGHPDFRFDGYPSDCKTVPLEEYLRDKVSRKIFMQMQAYMLYDHSDRALVIMEARDTGAIRDYWIFANQKVQQEIDAKYKKLVAHWETLKEL